MKVKSKQQDNVSRGLILFGAGASHGCSDVFPDTPPLGGQLFDELVRCYPSSWGGLPKDVGQTFSSQGFEKGMDVLYKSYNVLGLMSHMGLYFVQFRPKQLGSTAYAELARCVKDRGLESIVTLSTLNYECILELELSNIGLSFDYGFTPREKGRIPLLKPHGSCNFLLQGISGPPGAISMGYQAAIDGPMRAEPELSRVAEHCLTNSLPPVMCYFMEGKPVQVATNAIKQIQKRWQEEAQTSAAIVVVGVAVNPDDTHIWDFVRDSKAAVGYVAPKKSTQSFQKWCQQNRPQQHNVSLGDSFVKSIESICDFLEERIYAYE